MRYLLYACTSCAQDVVSVYHRPTIFRGSLCQTKLAIDRLGMALLHMCTP